MHRYAIAILLAWAGMDAQCGFAQNYPTRAIRLVVPSSPGGGSDILGRILAQKLGEALGQQVVVDNRAGAGGVIGVDIVAKSVPDGYTLLISPASLAINPSMYSKLPFNAMRDLAPITQLVSAANVLAVHPSVPAKTVKELIALARAKPGNLVAGSAGVGTSPHLSAELFKAMAKLDMVIVPYKGSGQGMVSLLAGEIALMFPTLPSAIQYIKAGKLRALGVTTTNRAAVLPDVPAIADAGLPGYEATQWFGILAPAGTPRTIIERLHQEITRALRAPDVKDRMTAEGTEVVGSTPEEFASHIKLETEKWARVIKAAGIKPE